MYILFVHSSYHTEFCFKVDFPPKSANWCGGVYEGQGRWGTGSRGILGHFLGHYFHLKLREEIHKFLSYLEDALSPALLFSKFNFKREMQQHILMVIVGVVGCRCRSKLRCPLKCFACHSRVRCNERGVGERMASSQRKT